MPTIRENSSDDDSRYMNMDRLNETMIETNGAMVA